MAVREGVVVSCDFIMPLILTVFHACSGILSIVSHWLKTVPRILSF